MTGPMGDQQNRFAAPHALYRGHGGLVGLEIQRAAGFVEDYDRRVLQIAAGEVEPLHDAGRQVVVLAVADARLETFRQHFDFVQYAGVARRLA